MTGPVKLPLAVPHDFSELLSASRNPSLIFGTGLSAGRVPAPLALLAEVRTSAEKELGVSIGPLPNDNSALYIWAEAILKEISLTPGDPPKLRLARAMGMLNDRRWAVDVDLNGALARHRVIARFAREELWAAIWSLNWDCMLESALENVGFVRGESIREQPWLTTYSTIVRDVDFNNLGQRNLLSVRKPHGCAHALSLAEDAIRNGEHAVAEELSSRFMITETELREVRKNPLDQKFFHQMVADIQAKSLLVAGWSISEPYLIDVVRKSLAAVLGPGKKQDLSIVDVEFNTQGHQETTSRYKLTKDDVFFEVTKLNSGFDIDDLFLWLQGKYSLDQLMKASEGVTKAKLADISKAFVAPGNQLIISWADKFLPAWTRVCWRGNLVDCAGFQLHKLALDKRNEHIPWRVPEGLPRPDLRTAATLLAALPQNGSIDVESFPGALWMESSRRLVVPMPAWGPLNVLAALKPLVDGFPRGLAPIDVMEVLPLHPTQNSAAVSAETTERLVADLASVVGVPQFADPRNIGVAIDLGT